ncbi:MAG: filamentous hemagglutinin N-terminal domain-containing protein, partial [Zavarzinia sp.]|nr:filamentous hemagglutinin N-terminal domain-containing protein [Zavarzinia sp.]
MTGLTLPARSRSALLATSALALLAAQGAWAPALANPSGGTVTHGGATITTAPDTVTIEQTTDRAVIEWQDFSVDGGETTRFVQPNASSVALNRVTGDNASVINGTITANGNVFLINRNGVLVGSGANIDVGGLVATTSDIDDGAFMAGGGRFDTPTDNPSATVVNQGTITVADHGIAALVGPTVENDGVIAARLGTVALGSAETFTVDLAGDGLISFDTGQPVARDAGTPQVSNAGTIAAAGGTVILSAGQAAAVVDKAIDMTGVVTATAISAEGGVIVLSGGEGEVSVDGTLDVSGTGAGTSGGTIEVTGKTVSLGATASLDAGGAAGGGTIRVGGGLKGTGTTPRAKTTSVAEGARLDASARDEGDGGLIVVWSDEKTTFGGTVLATGGTNGGDGGLIETSSAGMLDFGDFTIDASAPAGSGGEWLIDPGDVFILEEEAGNLPSNPFDPSNDTTLIFIDSIAAVLATGTDVTINTGSVGDGLSGTGEIGWEASTLPFAIGGDGSATLTLNALAGINWTGNLIASAGDLAVVLNAGEAISFGTGTIGATTIEMNGCLTSATCGVPVGSGGDDFIGISLSPGGSGSLLDLTADVVSLRAGGGGLFVGDGTTIDAATSLVLQGRGDQAFTFQAGSVVNTQPGSTASFQPTFANSDLIFIARDARDFSNDNIDQDDLAALAAFDTIEFVTGAAFATFATDDGSASDASIGFFGGFADATLDLPNNLLLDANDGGSVIIDGSLTVSVGGAASFQAERLIAIANRFVAGADINFEAPDMLFGADVVSTGGGLALRGNVGAVNSMLFSASTDILIDGDLDGTNGTPAPVPPAIEMRTKSGTITVTGDSGGSFPLASLLAVSPVSIEIGSITTLGDQTLDAPVTTLTGIRYDADGFFQVSGTALIANTASVIGTDGILFGGDVLRAPGAPAASLTAVAGLGADIDILGVAGTAADPLDALDLTADNVLSLQGAVTTGDQRFVATTAFFGGVTYASSLGGVSAAGVTTSLLDGTMVVEAAGDVAFGAVDAFSPGAGMRITSRGGR